MSLSMYQASVPVFIRMLANLNAILTKTAAHCEANKIDPAVLMSCRLYPNMFAFAKQVQVACDAAKNGSAYLAGVEPIKFDNTEQTFADLAERINKTIEFVNSIQPEQIDGTEDKDVVITRGQTTVTYKGQAYLLNRTLPNFYFHITTAYDILRHNGVPLGKKDYLGN